jgi:hypothetical protein
MDSGYAIRDAIYLIPGFGIKNKKKPQIEIMTWDNMKYICGLSTTVAKKLRILCGFFKYQLICFGVKYERR